MLSVYKVSGPCSPPLCHLNILITAVSEILENVVLIYYYYFLWVGLLYLYSCTHLAVSTPPPETQCAAQMSESPDISLHPPPVYPDALLQRMANGQGNGSCSVASTPGDVTRDLVESSESQRVYYCGLGRCRPAWMQRLFANAKFFTLLLCAYAFVEGAIVSGEVI